MTPSTKAEALRKLDTLYVGVGYPESWRDYVGSEVNLDDVVGNLLRGDLWEYQYQRARLGRPVDREEWVMTPQTNNAVNLPLHNALNFPAAGPAAAGICTRRRRRRRELWRDEHDDR